MQKALRLLYAELSRMGVGDWNVIVSTNVELRRDGLPYSNRRRPDDPGAAVYFRLDGEPHVLACDRWLTPEENVHALCKHIGALRGQDRWGVGSMKQAFAGYKQLPQAASVTSQDWWQVFELPQSSTEGEVRAERGARVKVAHMAGDGLQVARLQDAWKAFKKERGIA
jgi:hypothetical protein